MNYAIIRMIICGGIISGGLFFVLLPHPAHGTAWLKQDGALEVSVSRRTSQFTTYQQGIAVPYGRHETEFYAEYGLAEHITLSGKFATGRSGAGRPIEQTPVQRGEINTRLAVPWAQSKLLPYGTEALWQYFNGGTKPHREQVASVETGLGFNSQRKDDINLRLLLALADKVATRSENPVYLYTEISGEVMLWPQGDESMQLISRMEIGHRRWYVAYQRIDGRTHTYYNQHVHLWFGEVAIPLHEQHHLLLKWGRDRVHPNAPREDYFTVTLRFRFG